MAIGTSRCLSAKLAKRSTTLGVRSWAFQARATRRCRTFSLRRSCAWCSTRASAAGGSDMMQSLSSLDATPDRTGVVDSTLSTCVGCRRGQSSARAREHCRSRRAKRKSARKSQRTKTSDDRRPTRLGVRGATVAAALVVRRFLAARVVAIVVDGTNSGGDTKLDIIYLFFIKHAQRAFCFNACIVFKNNVVRRLFALSCVVERTKNQTPTRSARRKKTRVFFDDITLK